MTIIILGKIRSFLLICIVTFVVGCQKRENSSASGSSESENPLAGGARSGARNTKDTYATRITVNSEAEQALQEFASGFENVAGQYRDQDTLAKQKELALAVLPKLGGGVELLKFLDYLTERGAGDLRKEVVEKHLGLVFSGPNAQEAREWLLSMEDEKLRESLSRQAGLAFSGPGFKEFFERMGDYGGHHSQAALLSGYCQALANADPEAAVRVYKELGYPKRIDNTGLANVYAAMPPNTDFLKFATEIKEDSMTLAKRCRSALLRNWAGVKPEEAAQYVLGNLNSGVAPDQMAEVVSVWAGTTPDSAASWIANAPAGPAKDEGSAALATHWSATDPTKAWGFAAQVSDFQKRVETATAVFEEWEKTDREAATKAWVDLFSGD